MNDRRTVGLLTGGSHFECLGIPAKTEDGRLKLMRLSEAGKDFHGFTGPWPRDEDFWMELEKLAPAYKVFLSWTGNQHMAAYLFASNPPFDFVLSVQPDLPIVKNSILVPEEMLRQKFAPTLEKLGALLKRIAHVTPHGVAVCGTPPPKGNAAVIRAALAKEPVFVQRLAKLASSPETVPLTALGTLYKMWRLIQVMLHDVAHKCGAEFVPVPAEAQTPEGFLREDFWASDVTHANERYGKLFLSCLRQRL